MSNNRTETKRGREARAKGADNRPGGKNRGPAARRWALLAGLTVVVAVAAAVWIAGGDAPSNVATAESEGDQHPVATYAGLPVDGTSIGDPDAPVTVEEYFDFRCPHCRTASDNVVDPLIDQYVRAGDVRFVYKFFPILGPDSVMAARGAYCAALEDRFWPYQEVLFDKQGQSGTAYDPYSLAAYAQSVGMDEDAFATCAVSEESYDAVAESYNEGQRLGLPGTPTFIVNGKVLRGMSFEAVEAAIQDALEGV